MKSIIKYLVNRFERLFLDFYHVKGKKYCPLCEKKVTSFNPIPADFLEKWQYYRFEYNPLRFETLNIANYSCPFCGASDRDRLYALYFKQYLKNFSKQNRLKLLDIAPVFSLSKWLKKRPEIEYRSADQSGPMADDKIDIMDMNIYPDENFDFVLCSHVLEHVKDDKQAIKEIFRILKRGGAGILMVPIHLDLQEIIEDPELEDESERWRRFGQDDHIRLYSKKGFHQLLIDSGFTPTELTSSDFAEDDFLRCGIRHESVLYIVTKK